MLSELRTRADKVGLTIVAKSDYHWHVLGGRELLNLYKGKRGYAVWSQSMKKGRSVSSARQVVDIAKGNRDEKTHSQLDAYRAALVDLANCMRVEQLVKCGASVSTVEAIKMALRHISGKTTNQGVNDD